MPCAVCGRDECGDDTMCIHSPAGTKVRFADCNGYPAERDHAKSAGLKVGEVYEVGSVNIGSWSSRVALADIDGWFNTVMFEPVTT